MVRRVHEEVILGHPIYVKLGTLVHYSLCSMYYEYIMYWELHQTHLCVRARIIHEANSGSMQVELTFQLHCSRPNQIILKMPLTLVFWTQFTKYMMYLLNT